MTQSNPNKLTYPVNQIVTRTASVQLNPTVNTSAYVANNTVGGLLTFPGIAGPQQSGIVQSIHVNAKSVQTTGYKFYLFNSKPGTTTVTDRANTAINAADIPSYIGVYTLGAADTSLGTATINILDNIGKSFVASTPNLYGILTVNATPTYTTTSDVFVTLTVLQD
jgi:hypothetical protein